MIAYDFYQNQPIPKPASYGRLATVRGTDHEGQRHAVDLEDINLLCTGATKSGKTHFVKKILSQTAQRKRKNSIHIIFDPKGDYLSEFFESGDVILSLTDLPNYPASAQPKWNLLEDITYDGELEMNAREVAQTIFNDILQGSQNPYFPQAACNLFSNLLIAMCRHCHTLPSTRDAIQKICSMKKQEMINACEQYTDLASTKQLIGNEAPQTVAGVLGELINCLQNKFRGNFLGVGDFSLREFIKNRTGKKLFVEFKFDNRESSAKAIRLILDILMKGALAGSNADRIYFYLDEFPVLPGKLTYLPDLVNFGRQSGIRVIAGIQSVAQLYSTWSEKDGNALLAGFVNNIVFFCNDADSIRYFSEHAGEIIMPVTNLNLDFTTTTTIERVPIVPAYVLSQLSVGDAVVFERKVESNGENQYPYWFHFEK